MADIQKPLAIAVLVAMVAGIGSTLANAWFFFLADPAEPPTSARTESQPVEGGEVPIEQLAALNLFGEPTAAAGRSDGAALAETLRETRLSLELVGVFVADDGSGSRALIAQKGREAESFAPGDRLPGNARLEVVYWNQVVISRGGVRERIVFEHRTDAIRRNVTAPRRTVRDRNTVGRDIERSAAQAASPRPSARGAQQALARYREEFANDPEQLLAESGVQLAGDRDGYVIGALADMPEFSHTGLQRGDRIVSVNGQTVGDPRQDRALVEDLVGDGATRLEIQRGDRRFTVTIN